MTEKVVLYLILALVVVGIMLVFYPDQNVFGAVKTELSYKNYIVEKLSSPAFDIKVCKIGSRYDYTIKGSVKFKLTPEADNNLIIVPVINFKDVHAELSDYKPSPNDEFHDIIVDKTLNSRIPSRQLCPSVHEFVEGEECFYETDSSNRVFLVKLGDVEEKQGSLSDISIFSGIPTVCKAKMLLECSDRVIVTDYLQKCENDIESKDCSQFLSLCGGDIQVAVHDINCQEKKAKIFVRATSAVSDWTKHEDLKISFFRKSRCIEGIGDLSRLRDLCAKDFLGAQNFETGLAEITCR